MLLVSSPPPAPGGTGKPSGTWGASGASTPTHGRNIATKRTTAGTAAITCPWDNLPVVIASSSYFFLPPRDERLALDERDPLDFEERDLVELKERDLDEVEREPLALLRPDFAPAREPERAAGFFAVERRVVEPLDPPLRRAGFAAGGGVGVADGALADAARVLPPGTDTSASVPSSRSASSAPTAIAIAAASPRKRPIFRSPGLAKIRQTMIATVSRPSAAVPAPLGAGTLSRCPDIASRASAGPATAARKTTNPVTSVPRPSQPLTPPVSNPSTPAPNQSKNRNTNRAMPPIPATISPVRSLEESKSALRQWTWASGKPRPRGHGPD